MDEHEEQPWPRRQRVADVCLTLLAYLVAATTLAGEFTADPRPAMAWLVLDTVAAVVAPALLMFRRRWPIPVVAILLAVTTVSTTSGAAAAVASIMVRRRYQQALAVAGSALAAVTINLLVRQGFDVYWPIFGVLVVIGAIELGLFLRLRLRLAHEAAQRIRRAEVEEKARIEHARRSERLRIARDMHDVLAHRISLLSMHAGALAFRPDAPAEDVAATAEVIRGASHDILTDLQKVIGVLRDDSLPPDPDLRTPGLHRIGELIDDAVRSGQPVRADELPETTIPEAAGRTAYRVVQEGLTNARKHAPGRPVRIEFATDDGLTVVVSNELARSTEAAVPGSGLGLIGLRERVELLGGRLRYGPASGTFRLTAWLPLAS
ncbi:histidine kinase [Kribbella sp. NBC_00709]|uniref:sensor histidine kinase n=1 Tax=Kribbella sp. NBC_00709 TaxID=2975972 RepID=UPI002E2C7529|nr:histidine kinase [Kribbella sp. NBC_00709]